MTNEPDVRGPLSVVYAGRVACSPPIDDGGIVYAGETILAVGSRASLEQLATGAQIVLDAPDGVLTPGLIDAHTHAVYAGSRHREFAQKLAGEGYEAIAAAGGGIVATRAAVVAATREQLADTLERRVRRMARLGVTTVEVKSGYGLDEASERKQLEAIALVRARPGVPTLVPTFLALHAIPPEARADREGYIRGVVEGTLPEVIEAGVARFVDCYVDRNAFSADEAERVLAVATKAGLGCRLHVGQFADVGGAELAARYGAASVDHMEHATDASLDALAAAKVAVVLLPIASLTLAQSPPPVERMRARGLSLVVASDANPGTAATESLPLALALAARTYGLTPAEVLAGATEHAARALAFTDRGVLRAGARADFVVWDLPHEGCLAQPFGSPPTRLVARGGEVIYRDDVGPFAIRRGEAPCAAIT